MLVKEFTVLAPEGLHARPAKGLLNVAKAFKSSIMLEKDLAEADARSMLGILSMQAAYNSRLKVKVEGEDEEEAMAALTRFFEKDIISLD